MFLQDLNDTSLQESAHISLKDLKARFVKTSTSAGATRGEPLKALINSKSAWDWRSSTQQQNYERMCKNAIK